MQLLTELLDLVNTSSVFPLLLLLLLAYPLASRAWNTKSRIYESALRVGAATFVTYVVAMLVTEGRVDGWFWLSIFWRGLVAGAVVGVLTTVGLGIWTILCAEPLVGLRQRLLGPREGREAWQQQRQKRRQAMAEAELAAEYERRQAPSRQAAQLADGEAQQLEEYRREELLRLQQDLEHRKDDRAFDFDLKILQLEKMPDGKPLAENVRTLVAALKAARDKPEFERRRRALEKLIRESIRTHRPKTAVEEVQELQSQLDQLDEIECDETAKEIVEKRLQLEAQLKVNRGLHQ